GHAGHAGHRGRPSFPARRPPSSRFWYRIHLYDAFENKIGTGLAERTRRARRRSGGCRRRGSRLGPATSPHFAPHLAPVFALAEKRGANGLRFERRRRSSRATLGARVRLGREAWRERLAV